jgi:cell volume regulation protein A
MVQRKDSDIIVPIGDTLVLEDDKVIMIKVEHEIEFPRVD